MSQLKKLSVVKDHIIPNELHGIACEVLLHVCAGPTCMCTRGDRLNTAQQNAKKCAAAMINLQVVVVPFRLLLARTQPMEAMPSNPAACREVRLA